jgi:N-acetylglucosamine kinase-like BadF-type ATPase
MGFNPYFHSAEVIHSELSKDPHLGAKVSEQIESVYFYGAGCSSPYLNKIVKQGLQQVFTRAEVSVDHDLLAAAYSTYRGVPEISCILGTGSNSVYFDGNKAHEEVPALAYVLGDEGSGSFLGKRLLSTYLYKKLPQDLAEDFILTYGLSKDDIIKRVYNEPNANVWLASLSKFYGKHPDHPWVREVVREGFRLFRDIHILCFENAKEVEVNFVGSVAYHFQDILKDVLEEVGLSFGYVLRRPLDGLVAYHIEYLNILKNKEAEI